MTRTTTWLGALALAALATGGCRAAHLGPDTGETYRRAIERQRASDAEPVAELDADDARAAVAAQRGRRAKAGGKAGGSAAVVTTSTSSSSSGLWQGATGPIRLDAK